MAKKLKEEEVSKMVWNAYAVSEVENGTTRWNKIGRALPNMDGSFNIWLESLPINEKIHLRKSAD